MRFTGTASLEDNTIDPADNPIIDAEIQPNDPIEPKDVTLEVQPEVDGVPLKDDVKTNDELVAERELKAADDAVGNVISASDALDTIAVEMAAVVAEFGKLTSGEVYVTNQALKSLGLEQIEYSPENFNTAGMQYVTTQASMEGLIRGVYYIIGKLGVALTRAIFASIAIVKTLTPKLDQLITKATAVRAAITDAHREAGSKTITGIFTDALSVDGQAPRAETVIKTAATLNTVCAEVLSQRLPRAVRDHAGTTVKEIKRAFKEDFATTSHASGWNTILVAIFIPIPYITEIKMAVDTLNGGEKLRLDPKTILDFTKICPSIGKFKTQELTGDGFIGYRSEHLFGGKAIGCRVFDQNQQVGGDFKLRQLKSALEVISLDTAAPTGEVQALTAKEQRAAIDQAIAILTTVRQYYKSYPDIAKLHGQTMNNYFDISSEVQNASAAGGKSYAGYMYRSAITLYGTGYFGSVVSKSVDVAKYAVTSARAIISLVEESARVAQVDSEPSTEDLGIFEN